MTDIAAIAYGLTEAQRKALSAPKWCMMDQYDAGIFELLNYGILKRDGYGHEISQLGQQVRQYLIGKSS